FQPFSLPAFLARQSNDDRHPLPAPSLEARLRLAGLPRTVLLRQLRLRELAGQPPQRRPFDRVSVGARHSVSAVDDRSLLVDRPALRDLALPLHDAPGARPACPAPPVRPVRLRGLLHRLSPAVLVSAAPGPRILRRSLHA